MRSASKKEISGNSSTKRKIGGSYSLKSLKSKQTPSRSAETITDFQEEKQSTGGLPEPTHNSEPRPSPNKSERINALPPFFLKNAIYGQEYHEKIDISKIVANNKVISYTIGGLDKIGLKLNKSSHVISGKPSVFGEAGKGFEFPLVLRYRTEYNENEKRDLFIKILQDPKSLWKELEPPDSLQDKKLPHVYGKTINLGGHTGSRKRFLTTASKRGRLHAHKALCRDDHVKIKHLEKIGWSIIAVADGAGSARLARAGSQIACETAVQFLEEKLLNDDTALTESIKSKNEVLVKNCLYNLIAAAAFESSKKIQTEAAARKANISDFHSTLLLAIHKDFDFGSFIAGFWIGDGALAVFRRGKQIILLGEPDRGQHSGETVFLTMQHYMDDSDELSKRIHFNLLDDFTALIAMTDGVSDPKFETDNNLKNLVCWDSFWQEIWDNIATADFQADLNIETIHDKLIDWLDFWSEGEHDDRTIAILT